jgi:hypothetical protein
MKGRGSEQKPQSYRTCRGGRYLLFAGEPKNFVARFVFCGNAKLEGGSGALVCEVDEHKSELANCHSSLFLSRCRSPPRRQGRGLFPSSPCPREGGALERKCDRRNEGRKANGGRSVVPASIAIEISGA